MKKFKKIAVALLGAMLVFAGCEINTDEPNNGSTNTENGGSTSDGNGNITKEHVHTYSEEWTSDGTNHWHAATCEHTDEVSEKAAHTFVDYTSNNDATTEADGTKSRTCSVCGYVETVTDEGSKVYNWYESPVDAQTLAAATSASTYIYFGVFPKTVLANDSTVTVDENTSVTMGANTYYKGSDGEYYAKVTENPYSTSYTYSDNSTVSSGSTRYFKVEPIKWRVLTTDYNSTGKALLLAEDILTANVLYYVSTSSRAIGEATVYANNYKYSTIRAYLNGSYESDDTQTKTYTDKGFLQTAFTTNAQELIATTEVDNSGESTTDATGSLIKADGTNSSYPTDYTCANTKDKIFLLSENEVTTTGYGFTAYNVYGTGNSRIRVTTDYAKANFAYQNTTTGCGGWWWLRSPYCIGSVVARAVLSRGGAGDYSYNVYYSNGGVVPALSISLQ